MDRVELQAYIEENYGEIGEKLFVKDPAICVFRHQSNRKWFAVIMDIPKNKLGLQGAGNVSVVNLKCDVRLIGSFRLESGIYPAYHMSKNHWLSVLLDNTVTNEKVKFLLEMSYDLTKGRKK